jgi:hypothetical protein
MKLHSVNCKVKPGGIMAASLETVLQPFVGKLTEEAVHACWSEAAKRTHDATVDALAKKPSAYCVACFKEELKKASCPS